MVKIRLQQTGARNRRMYRIIAIDENKRRDGRAIENLGHYNPCVSPPALTVDHERVEYWISCGAQMTDSAKKLIESHKT